MSKENKINKQSLIAGALTSSAGILITKLISILYVIPYNEIAQNETVFYSYGYTVYATLLDICLSGLPFAIATLVAKYMSKNDKATVKLVRRISMIIIATIGLAFGVFVFSFAGPIAKYVLPTDSSYLYIEKTTNIIRIVSVSLIFVPLLSCYRGFYQGLKDMRVYSFTQVIEQIVRVTFLLSTSAFAVYVLHSDRIWAAYLGIISTFVSALVAIAYFIFYDNKVKDILSCEEKSSYSNKQIFIELIVTSIPYLLSSIITNLNNSIVLLTMTSGLEAFGYDSEMIISIQGIMNYQNQKLQSIPMVIMTGFCASLIPHIVEAVTNDDKKTIKNNIENIFISALYLLLPVCLFMALFAKDIYYIMYGNYETALGAQLLAKSMPVQFLINLYGIFSSIMLALKHRTKMTVMDIIRVIAIFAALKLTIPIFGIDGYFVSAFVEYLLFFLILVIYLYRQYKISIREVLKAISKILVSIIPMILAFTLFRLISFDITNYSRIISTVIIGFTGLITVALYLIISNKLELFKKVFNVELSLKKIIGLIKH